MSALVINKSDSYCQECRANILRIRTIDGCPECGAVFDTVTSDYTGGGLEEIIERMRPDLEPYFPFRDFWEEREGERLLAELNMDENQEGAA